MTVISESRISSVMRAAEALLSHRAGSPVVLADPEDLGGSGRTTVVRVRVAQNPLSMGRSLVIKALPEHENPHAFHREIASYKYATALPTASRPGPQLIASDANVRLMVLSDLGHGHSMTTLLADGDVVEATRAVSAWGQALGRMHAATVGGEGDFLALVRRGAPDSVRHDILRDEAARAVREARQRSAALGVPMPDRVVDMLEAAQTLFEHGDHRAFSPSDVGPENILLNDDGVQFMDYEWGGFRDATLDIAYALVTFASRLGPRGVSRRLDLEVSMVDAWRSEVDSIWPSLRHDREMQQKLIAARLLWVWLSTVWMLPADSADDVSAEPLAGADAGDTMPHGLAHDLALHTNDPRRIVSRWADIASAARGADTPVADFAGATGLALQRTWLA
ncbi:kae1-associated kinase [Gordonia sinesedis]